jgi:hypothetical protein
VTAAGDDRGPFLPSARQAMRYAVELASNPTPAAIDLDRARAWVTIAHELRIGEIPTRPFPRPLDAGNEGPPDNVPRATHFGDDSLLPVCDEVGPDDPEGALTAYDLRDVTCHACLRVVKERELAEQIAREDTPVARHAEYEATLANNSAGETASARVNRLAMPVLRRPEDTIVLQHGPAGDAPLNKCAHAHCGHLIEIDFSGGLGDTPAWVHVMTRQSLCPVSAPDQARTFATPLVDARG